MLKCIPGLIRLIFFFGVSIFSSVSQFFFGVSIFSLIPSFLWCPVNYFDVSANCGDYLHLAHPWLYANNQKKKKKLKIWFKILYSKYINSKLNFAHITICNINQVLMSKKIFLMFSTKCFRINSEKINQFYWFDLRLNYRHTDLCRNCTSGVLRVENLTGHSFFRAGHVTSVTSYDFFSW